MVALPVTTADGPGLSDAARRVPAWRDWRVLLGIGITIVAFGFAIRGIPLADVVDSMREAEVWVLLGLSIPAYASAVVFRGLRWRRNIATVCIGRRLATGRLGFGGRRTIVVLAVAGAGRQIPS